MHESNISPLAQMSDYNHEQVTFCYDKVTGLRAIIAIHNTVLGPGMGGTRMWDYNSEGEALTDALRLSRGMTLKNAIAGLNIGGGKAVIIGDAGKIKNEALMRKFGQFVDGLNGNYWTASDVNMTIQDMQYIKMETDYVTGLSNKTGGSGDPSPVTAYGVYMGMKGACKSIFGLDSLQGKKVMVQGVGKVGRALIDYLLAEDAEVMVSDLYKHQLESVSDRPVKVVGLQDIWEQDFDIYAPCALGATLNHGTIPLLKCAIIAGGANNQLEDEDKDARLLKERGIAYVPDFLINGGGITNVYFEQQGMYNRETVMDHTAGIYDKAIEVLKNANRYNITTHESAVASAMSRIDQISQAKLKSK